MRWFNRHKTGVADSSIKVSIIATNLSDNDTAWGLTLGQVKALCKYDRIRRRFCNKGPDTTWESLDWAFGEPDGFVDRTSTAKTAILKGSKT